MRFKSGVRGIIFDMDNTLLSSRIDFAAMKGDVYKALLELGGLPEPVVLEEHTTATLIGLAKERGLADGPLTAIWTLVAEHELRGMEGAGLEPGAAEMLKRLHGRLPLTVVTNNAEPAAAAALEQTGIARYIDLLVGREGMDALKPSPSGFLSVLGRYPGIPAAEWVSLGDSWIDGKAAMGAGVPFVSYGSPAGAMEARGVRTAGRILQLDEWIPWLEKARLPQPDGRRSDSPE
ncbi:HAD family hydrolase [Paenibacillus mucilaginosus]|uniref:Haloacid dehalogenase domain protein hydrolase n=1 Tax=Paenibacillus mucilaginosus (strain KNP414) TaxID=1036673 RepID=F8F5P2_PAEMK|nr:HAD family hydrolase [Paenibacillus mucilaginosus]AEI41215.1 Haloacid dehalogenase domain protein hydrolase [Paenibacillus mucilaginosus KNP414]MCG7211362.1 HAD hydrolase-like protein [Paenibacillus mucilaginosus]WDM30255.1 HAD hydrolase-like protein [Paenibacillus mucilaginosus]